MLDLSFLKKIGLFVSDILTGRISKHLRFASGPRQEKEFSESSEVFATIETILLSKNLRTNKTIRSITASKSGSNTVSNIAVYAILEGCSGNTICGNIVGIVAEPTNVNILLTILPGGLIRIIYNMIKM